MKAAGWIALAALGSGLVATAVAGTPVAAEILLGMLAPLAAVIVSWVMTERAFQREPARVTGLMIAAFGAKMLFFGVYVALMIGVVKLRPAPFVASFTGYFVALYLTEALLMRRRFAADRKSG
jgi:hypothetical protein